MALTKRELQQMLREMNVKFNADETYDELNRRLQQEHHNLWLKSISGDRPESDSRGKTVIRKRKKEPLHPESDTVHLDHAFDKPKDSRPSIPSTHDRPRRSAPPDQSHPIEKPEPGQPWKPAAPGTEPFNRKKNVFESVLKRADMCCERCGKPSDATCDRPTLQPFHIQPLAQGGEHSIKNVVALCPGCLEAMQKDPDLKNIKELKRKTRSKLYNSLEVVRKRSGRRRRGWPRKLQ